MSQLTKFRITVDVEFSEIGLAAYREAVDINYGDPTTKGAIRESLKGYALNGIEHHFDVMDIHPIYGSTI